MKLLCIGDVMGRPGREKLLQALPQLKRETGAEFIIVNGENASGGKGLNRRGMEDLLTAGADVVTMGNHVWDNKEIFQFIDDEPRLVRPANYPAYCPGKEYGIYHCGSNERIAVINLCGRVFMPALDCPFAAVDSILEAVQNEVDYIIVDFHAEATSEKLAMAYYLDGRVSAVVGTHTHVPTADARILPQGTAYITDLGMTGVQESVLGIKSELIIHKFLTARPVKYEIAEGMAKLQGVWIELDDRSGKSLSITQINI